MTASPRACEVVHAPGLAPLTAEQAELVEANLPRIGWTIKGKARHLIDGRYTADDAWQDGWLGLCTAAARFDPDGERTFAAVATGDIWRAISRGRGLVEGRNFRRRPAQRSWLDRARHHSHADELAPGLTIGDLLESDEPDPAAAAIAADDLRRAVVAGRRACTDHVDRAVLAWLFNPDDERTAIALGLELGRSGQAIGHRRAYLTRRMALAITTTSAKG